MNNEVKPSDLMDELSDKCIVYVQRQAEKDKFRDSLYQVQEFRDWFVVLSGD